MADFSTTALECYLLPSTKNVWQLLNHDDPSIARLVCVPSIPGRELKAWLVFGFFIWVRASLHRVRTDQILEFGWRYLLPLSVVQLGLSIWLRLGVYDGGSWPLIVPALITIVSIILFVVLVMDEDEDALAEQRRPYHVSEINKASPGARMNMED